MTYNKILNVSFNGGKSTATLKTESIVNLSPSDLNKAIKYICLDDNTENATDNILSLLNCATENKYNKYEFSVTDNKIAAIKKALDKLTGKAVKPEKKTELDKLALTVLKNAKNTCKPSLYKALKTDSGFYVCDSHVLIKSKKPLQVPYFGENEKNKPDLSLYEKLFDRYEKGTKTEYILPSINQVERYLTNAFVNHNDKTATAIISLDNNNCFNCEILLPILKAVKADTKKATCSNNSLFAINTADYMILFIGYKKKYFYENNCVYSCVPGYEYDQKITEYTPENEPETIKPKKRRKTVKKETVKADPETVNNAPENVPETANNETMTDTGNNTPETDFKQLYYNIGDKLFNSETGSVLTVKYNGNEGYYFCYDQANDTIYSECTYKNHKPIDTLIPVIETENITVYENTPETIKPADETVKTDPGNTNKITDNNETEKPLKAVLKPSKAANNTGMNDNIKAQKKPFKTAKKPLKQDIKTCINAFNNNHNINNTGKTCSNAAAFTCEVYAKYHNITPGKMETEKCFPVSCIPGMHIPPGKVLAAHDLKFHKKVTCSAPSAIIARSAPSAPSAPVLRPPPLVTLSIIKQGKQDIKSLCNSLENFTQAS